MSEARSPTKTPAKPSAGWKQRLTHALIEYGILAGYLYCFLCLFTWYRRLVLAEYQMPQPHYWVSLVEALVLAKVIMIGDHLHLGRRFQDRPLIVPTLYKAVAFALFVAGFRVLEHVVRGLFRGNRWPDIAGELLGPAKFEILAQALVTFVAFIPFFAFRELERVLGEGHLRMPLFRR
jgi:hypothetical protein